MSARQYPDVRLSNLDKVMYPATGTTKGEVVAYYQAVAPLLLPHTASRPATLKRWVDGVGTEETPRAGFFQKNTARAPDGVRLIEVQHRERSTLQPDVRDAATLAWTAQLAALELHVPQWRVDGHGTPLPADRIVFDLDPGPGMSLAECAEVARVLRRLLDSLGFTAMPVTSGSKGVHLYCPVRGLRADWSPHSFAHRVALLVEQDLPDLVVSDMSKERRAGRVLIDWSQNHRAKTTVAPYSLRGRAEPMVAAPRSWEELDDPGLRHLRLEEVLARTASHPDLLAALAPTG